MILLEKSKIWTHLQKLPKNGGDLGKIIVARGFKKLPKVQNIAQSGHTDNSPPLGWLSSPVSWPSPLLQKHSLFIKIFSVTLLEKIHLNLWFRLRLPSSNPKQNIYTFFIFYWCNCCCEKKRTKINENVAGICPFF